MYPSEVKLLLYHNSSNTSNEHAHKNVLFKAIYIVSSMMLNILQILFYLIPRIIYEESTVAREVS